MFAKESLIYDGYYPPLNLQSPESAMSAIRNTNSNTNIPYLHCKLVLVEVAIPIRLVVLPVVRLAIVVVVVPLCSHLRIHPSLKIRN